MIRTKSNARGSRATATKANRIPASAQELVQRAGRFALKSDSVSLDRAVALLREAASKGSAEADYAIGTWYGFGKHLPQDDQKAIKHFKRAAKKKFPAALFNLAYCHEVGRGLPKDPARAFTLYVEAAREGDRDAASAVYRCLFWGIGVTQNRPLAKLIQDLIDGEFARKQGLSTGK